MTKGRKKTRRGGVRPTVISFLLDESGSMETIKDDTIGGFNSYIRRLKQEAKGRIAFSLVKFDSRALTKVHVGVPLDQVAELNRESYRPGASTPLIDAAYKTISATEEIVRERRDNPLVIVVIQTDGHENSSREFTNHQLKELRDRLSNAGWQFTFLGAGIDAYSQASQWGIGAGETVSYGRGVSAQTFDTLANNTVQNVNSGGRAGMSYTAAQKFALGDSYAKRKKDNPATKR